jgi:hypothetical protein
MAQTLISSVTLGASKTGLALTLKATLLDSAGDPIAGQVDISTGFVEVGPAGTYSWFYAGFPDNPRCLAVFHTGAWAGTPVKLAVMAINLEEVGSLLSAERTRIADATLLRDWTAIVDTVPARCLLQAARWLRNRWTRLAGMLSVYKEDDTTLAWQGPYSTDAEAPPVTGVDPT